MPKIQFQKSERVIQPQRAPQISPGAFSAVSRAEAGVGEAVSRTAEQAGTVVQQIQTAERSMKSMEIDQGLQDDIADFTTALDQRTDYEQFEPDAQKHLLSLRSKYTDRIGGDTILQAAFDRKYTHLARGLERVTLTKKADIIAKRAQGAAISEFNNELQNYASEVDPLKREIIAKNIELGSLKLAEDKAISFAQAETRIQDFNNQSEALRADQMNMVDPVGTEKAILAGEFSTLDPTVRQQKLEDSHLRQRQAVAAAEKLENDAVKAQKITQEDNAVNWVASYAENAIVDFSKLNDDLRNHKISRAFYESFTKDIQSGPRDISDQQEILEVEEAIRQGESGIRDYILESPWLIPKDKGTLLDRDTAYQDKIFKEDNDRGEEQLKSKIITTSPFMPSAPGEAERFATAKTELYERLREKEPLDVVLKDMIPRYDSRPDKLSALPQPRFVNKPANLKDVATAKDTLLQKFDDGTIDMTTLEGQNMARRELELLSEYENIYERMAPDARR